MVPLLPRIDTEDLISPIPNSASEYVLRIGDASVLEFDPEFLAELLQLELVPGAIRAMDRPVFPARAVLPERWV